MSGSTTTTRTLRLTVTTREMTIRNISRAGSRNADIELNKQQPFSIASTIDRPINSDMVANEKENENEK